MAELKALVEQLVTIPGLSGYETKVSSCMVDAFRPFVDKVSVDKAGNVVAVINGSRPDATRVMVFAHLDQLGLVVRKIEPAGFIRFERLGGIPEKVLPGSRVRIESETGTAIAGIVGVKAHHATPTEERSKVVPYLDLFIDIGASSAEEVRTLGIDIGSPVVYEPRFTPLLGNRIAATSVDDRGGCAVLIKLAEHFALNPTAVTLQLVGSVQEEFNLRGAMVAAANLKPDLAISLDLMVSCDTPDLTDRGELALGKGPILGMYSFHGRGTLNGTIPHPGLVRHFRRVARESAIPLQRSANLGSLTDSAYVQLVGDGIPCIDLGFPVRYTHTPVETFDLRDLQQLLELVTAGLASMPADFSPSRLPGE